jgi:hypothetical protein
MIRPFGTLESEPLEELFISIPNLSQFYITKEFY